jgi:hypothetical protein
MLSANWRELEYSSREATSFAYSSPVTLEFGQLEPFLAWCRTELVGEWRWEYYPRDAIGNCYNKWQYRFYFDSERDCLAVTLKWA